METIIKKTREVGTSAGVLLPRKWLNRQVVVTLFEPSKEKILQDVTGCLFKYNLNEEVKGIYLFGSYARGDFDFHSDIDILIITHNVSKLVYYENYEITFVPEISFSKNLTNSLNCLGILKEAKVVLNKELIDRYRSKKHRIDTKKFLPEIRRIFRINKESIETCRNNKMSIPDGIVYSLVLRLRELYMIKCLLSGRPYSKGNFLEYVGENAYSAYLRVKERSKELNNLSPDELKNILKMSEKWLKELRG
ncbi:nucleotidyltransferase domain-containing protein [Candidatus Woesearchaeota archaeon]|nr:nucleotidyltransferase domain-containing protein [Candidatus Woesearchaeota archaeon]